MRKFVWVTVILSLLAHLSACLDLGVDNTGDPDGEERTELILATDTSSSDIGYIVSSFNKSSEDYTIKVVYYGSLEKNMDNLRTEIIAGNPPDIYAFSQSQLADVEIPIYEDLLPYLDNDPSYSREAFVPGLFKAIIKVGSLDYIPYDFYVETFTARESVVGARPGITMEEAEGFANDMGPDVNIFPAWLPREALLAHIVHFSASKFIDRAAGECDFLNPEFIKLLEQCRAHPYSPSEDYSFGSNLLEYRVLQSFVVFVGLHNGYGTDYSFVGFPTPNRDGSSFGINLRFSISSGSKHKAGAWEFVRTVMSEENQEKAVFFPVIQSELDKQIETVLEGDEFTSEVKLEQFEMDRFINLINSVTKVSADTDTTLYKIISAEAAPFFAGDRTAEEAAQLIQERAVLYIAEKR